MMLLAPHLPARVRRTLARTLTVLRLALLASATVLAGCGGSDGGNGNTQQTSTTVSVRLTPATGTVDVGSTLQLNALPLNSAGLVVPGRTVTWSSGTPGVATVSASGLVTGVTTGTVTISATADGQTGTATIAVQPSASQRCDVKDSVAVGQTITGTLSSTDCQLGDGTYADKYALTIAQAGPVRINMLSASLDSYLILQNAATGTVVAENDDGNGNPDEGSRIEMVLQPGRYVVTTNTFQDVGTGSYSLTVSTGSQACVSTSTINSPSTISGTLAATACVLGDSSYVDRYLLTVPATNTYTVTMRSSALNAFLFMENAADGDLVGRNDDSGGGANGKDARFSTTLPQGSYVISANSAGPRETGTYTLTVSEDQCQATRTVTPGTTTTDTLTSNSCRLNDGSYVRRYAMTLAAPTALRLDATSTQFDPYLIIQQAGATATLAEDDDSGPGTNAQVLQVLAAGSYVVTVTSATAGETGSFTLAVAGASSTPVDVSVTPATVSLTPGQGQQLTATVNGNSNTSVAWSTSAPAIVAVSATGQVRGLVAGTATITATSAADPSKVATSVVTVTDGGSTNLDIPLVLVTQSMQTLDGKVPLVSGRATVARVFVRGSTSGLPAAAVRLRIFNGATLLGTLRGTAQPQTFTDETCCAATITVPASMVVDGATIIADVDPDNTVAESNEGDNAWPLTGVSKAMRVVTVPTVRIQLVPIKHNGTGAVGPSTTTISELMPAMYPTSQVIVTVHPEYATDLPALTDVGSWTAMLRRMELLRSVENGTAYYFGVLAQPVASGVIGIATLGGFAEVGVSSPIDKAQETFTHEMGHSFGRQHSPTPATCGSPSGVDPDYPRPDGQLGNSGYNVATGTVYAPSAYDIMGYCDDTWASAFTYTGIMAYLRSGVIPTSESVPIQSLIVGGSLSDGSITLDPVFTATTTPTRSRAGRFVAEGLAADGRVLFSHRFSGNAVGDGDAGTLVFSERVAYDAAASGAVASIRVRDTGASGSSATLLRAGTYTTGTGGVSLRIDSDPQVATRSLGGGRHELTWNVSRYPSVIVRNRTTGTVLAMGARGAISFAAAALDDVELLLSDGTSSTTRRLSTGGAP